MSELLSSLNEAQRDAALHRGTPLIVLAGPGTGKTRAIIARIASLIQRERVAPESIVAVTFTVKAAQELRDRLAEHVGPAADAVNAHTMHGFGRRLLKRFGDVLGLPSEPEMIDSAQTRRLLRSLVREHGLFASSVGLGIDAALTDALSTFDKLRNAAIEPAEALRRANQWRNRPRLTPSTAEEAQAQEADAESQRVFADTARLYGLFETACRDKGWLTFADLIALPRTLLRDHPGKAAIVRHEYQHFVVDEFQDSNAAQIELLKLLAPGRGADLCVVGDDDQAIYGFNGADDRCFEMFDEAWPSRRVVELSANYRSAPAIVEVCNRVIAPATRYKPDKTVRAAHADMSGLVQGVELGEWREDAVTIAAMILADRAQRPDARLKDYAVLGRNHADLDRVAATLAIEGIPAVRVREGRHADDPAVLDLLAWVQLLVEPESTASLHRLLVRPPAGIDPAVVAGWDRAYRAARSKHQHLEGPDPGLWIDWLRAKAQEPDAPPGLALFLARHQELQRFASTHAADATVFEIATRNDLAHAELSPPEERASRVRAVVSAVRFARERQRRLEEPGDLAAFWSYYQDLDPSEQQFAPTPERAIERPDDPDHAGDDAVRLLTAHASKGLEFDTVFVTRVISPFGFPLLTGSPEAELPEAVKGRTEPRTPAERRLDEERRLFYVACTRAQRRLVLLAEKLAPKSKSKGFFREIILDESVSHGVSRLWGPDLIGTLQPLGLSLRSIDRSYADLDESALSVLRDERLRARRAAALALDRADTPSATAEDLDAIAAELSLAARRLALAAAVARTGQPPAWSPAADARALVQQIRATRRDGSWIIPRPPLDLSYTSINDYLDCPRCWYVKHVMGLGESDDRSLAVGSIVHRALETHFRAVRDAEAEGLPVPALADLLAAGRRELERQHRPTQVVEGDEIGRVTALLTNAHALHESDANLLEIERSVRFAYPSGGVQHRFVAKLDRVDQVAGELRVVDYKTGTPTKRLLTPDKRDLQLGIYAMALRELMKDASLEHARAEYWILANGKRGAIALAQLDLDKINTTIHEAIRGILAGSFEVGKDCRGLCAILGDARPGIAPG